MHSIYIYHLDIYWYICRISCCTTGCDIFIDGKENAKMTGDRMKMLMLTLPFMVCDLIAPEVHPALHRLTLHIGYTWYIAVY